MEERRQRPRPTGRTSAHTMWKSVACCLVLTCHVTCAVKLQPPPMSSILRYTRFLTRTPCPFAEEPAVAVAAALRDTLVAQDDAIASIVSRVQTWNSDALAGRKYPLVLALTGSTGVGKTSAALAIARAVSVTTKSTSGAGKDVPEAFFAIDGSDYSAGAATGVSSADTAARRARVLDTLAQALYECHGNVVLVVDEAQKAQHGVFDALSPVLQGEHALVNYQQDTSNGRITQLDASRLVLIFVSDIGTRDIERYITQAAAAAENGSHVTSALTFRRIQEQLRSALSARTPELGINLGVHAQAVIPFLPFSQSAVQQFLQARITRWQAQRSALWDTVQCDAAALADVLSDEKYTKYVVNMSAYAEARREVTQAKGTASATVTATATAALAPGQEAARAWDVRPDGSTASLPPQTENGGGSGTTSTSSGGSNGEGEAARPGTALKPGATHMCSRVYTAFAWTKLGARHLEARAEGSPLNTLFEAARREVERFVVGGGFQPGLTTVTQTVKKPPPVSWRTIASAVGLASAGGTAHKEKRTLRIDVQCPSYKTGMAAAAANAWVAPQLSFTFCLETPDTVLNSEGYLVWTEMCQQVFKGQLPARAN